MKRSRPYSSGRSGNVKKKRNTQFRAPRRTTYRRQNARTGGFLAIENKFYDTTATGFIVSPVGAVAGAELDPTTLNTISAPAHGDGEQNRDGKKMIINSVQVQGQITIVPQINQTDITSSPTIMVALVQDTQTNGVQLNSEDVYTNPGTVGALAPFSMRNLQYSSRFKVLAKEMISAPQLQATYDGTNIEIAGQIIPFSFYKKVMIPVTFTGATAGIASVVDNSLHIIVVGSGTDPILSLSYNARIRFKG